MGLPLFPVQEIGSLMKPGWRVKSVAGKPVGEQDVREAQQWGQRIGVDTAQLVSTLRKPRLTEQDKAFITDQSALFGLRYLESAGLDLVYDGEQRRSEMYQAAVEHIEGFRFLGSVRSFDNKYYLKAAVVQEPKLQRPYHIDEFRYLRQHAQRTLKVPLTGAFTIADWSFNEHYLGEQAPDVRRSKQGRKEATRDLVVAIARNALRPTIAELVKQGATNVQIDEPAAATKPDQVDLMVEGFNEAVQGLQGRFSLHFCFSDYHRFFPDILELKNCAEYTTEFANRDSHELGTTRDVRNGYYMLELMKEHGDPRDMGVGVVDVHNDPIESPELVRDRLLYAAKVLGPERVRANPDCGLRTRSWDVAYAKLQNIARGAALARQEQGGKR
jgi:5-methyltetrahydropteroyltriglutamate--homocysteine methyltransferase